MDFRVFVVGMAVLCTSVSSAALTLGRVRGAAILGQPLDISIQVQLDADEAASSLCVEADVFHADTRQDSGRVRVSVEAAQQAQAANVRIYSSGQVDEPMVTVYLGDPGQMRLFLKYRPKYVSLPNALLDRPLVPEMLHVVADPDGVAAHLEKILDAGGAEDQLAGFAEIRDLMGQGLPGVPVADPEDRVLALAAQRLASGS